MFMFVIFTRKMNGALVKTEPLDPVDNADSQTARQSGVGVNMEASVEWPESAENGQSL